VKPEKLLNNLYLQLKKHRVRYLVVGGMAVNYYGIIRATKDIDLFVEATGENMINLLQAMEAAGFETAQETTPEEMLKVDLTVFKDIIRVDVMTKVAGVDFEKAWKNRQNLEIRRNHIFVLHIDDLIASKRGTGRVIDEQDIAQLLMMKEIENEG